MMYPLEKPGIFFFRISFEICLYVLSKYKLYRTADEKRTGSGTSAGEQYKKSGRNIEAESEPGKEPDGQRVRKNNIESLNGWLYRQIRTCIWKQGGQLGIK